MSASLISQHLRVVPCDVSVRSEPGFFLWQIQCLVLASKTATFPRVAMLSIPFSASWFFPGTMRGR